MQMTLGSFLQLGLYFSNPIWQSPKKPCVFRPGSDVQQLMCRARFSPYRLSLYSTHVTACMRGRGWTDWNPTRGSCHPPQLAAVDPKQKTWPDPGFPPLQPCSWGIQTTHASAQIHLNSLFIFIAKADSQRDGETERLHLLFVSPNGNNDQS